MSPTAIDAAQQVSDEHPEVPPGWTADDRLECADPLGVTLQQRVDHAQEARPDFVDAAVLGGDLVALRQERNGTAGQSVAGDPGCLVGE